MGQAALCQGPFGPSLTLGLGPLQFCQEGGFFYPSFFHPLQLLPVFLALQGLLVGVQGGLPILQLPDPGFQPGGLDFQGLQGLKRLSAYGQSLPGLGQKAGFVILTFVFQFPQPCCQGGGGGAVVAGGHQLVQAAAQSFVLAHGQLSAPEKAGTLIHAAFCTQEQLAAVVRRQLRDGKAGFCLKSPELAHGNPPFGLPLDGDPAALPEDLHGPLHGLAGPGLVALFVRELALFGPLTGVDAVKHGQKKGAPGAFAPLVGGGNQVEAGGEGEGLVFQLAEGGGHGADVHGRVTSCPSRIWRLSRAARHRASASGPAAF